MYEVKVVVPTLDEASSLLKVLGERGYSQVSMGPPAQTNPTPSGVLLDQAKSSLNRMNDLIVSALYKLGAIERGKGATAEKIVGVLKSLPEAKDLFGSHSEGIVSRTVSMVASSVLGGKFSWVSYEKSTPRRFWLTAEGVKKARLLSGENQP